MRKHLQLLDFSTFPPLSVSNATVRMSEVETTDQSSALELDCLHMHNCIMVTKGAEMYHIVRHQFMQYRALG